MDCKLWKRPIHDSGLQVLEEQFPQPALLPKNDSLRDEVLRVCDECNDLANSGFGFMREGRTDENDGNVSLEAESSGRGTKSKFEEQLDKLEAVLRGNGGPFIMG